MSGYPRFPLFIDLTGQKVVLVGGQGAGKPGRGTLPREVGFAEAAQRQVDGADGHGRLQFQPAVLDVEAGLCAVGGGGAAGRQAAGFGCGVGRLSQQQVDLAHDVLHVDDVQDFFFCKILYPLRT